jgi:catechol 2,3-dioxygenase-like lactoylglutathione lyase family enzyme
MAVELNHTIVWSHDKSTSAAFLAHVLDVPVGSPVGPFAPIHLSNGVTLDYADAAEVSSQHYAFLVGDDEFDAALARIRDAGLAHWADPFHRRAGEINHDAGGRGVYFEDPAGHNMELLTAAEKV